jgi:hypothetical protein
MPLPPPEIAIAVVAACTIWTVAFFKRGEFDAGELVYLGIAGFVAAGVILFVPFRIPTTGQYVIAPYWDPPTYVDPKLEALYTSELVEKMRAAAPELITSEWRSKAISRKATNGLGSHWEAIWLLAFGLVIAGGWHLVPRMFNRFLYPRRPANAKSGNVE